MANRRQFRVSLTDAQWRAVERAIRASGERNKQRFYREALAMICAANGVNFNADEQREYEKNV